MHWKKGKKYSQFLAGMLAMLLLAAGVVSAAAASGKVSFNQVGVMVMGEEAVKAGQTYAAANGRQIPSSITYTDEAGEKTHYLPVEQTAELLDADVSWDGEANCVNIGYDGKPSGPPVITGPGDEKPKDNPVIQYGLSIGALEEIDPATLPDLSGASSRTYANARVQYGPDGSFSEIVHTVLPQNGNYLVYTVKNDGNVSHFVTVGRVITISYGRREMFPSVLVDPGETVTRVFRVNEGFGRLESNFAFGVAGGRDKGMQADFTVTLKLYTV